MTGKSSFISLTGLKKELSGILAVNRPAETAAFEAVYIIGELSGLSRNEIALYPERRADDIYDAAIAAAERRARWEPLQYIFGRAYFMNLELEVSPDVLIPRPETELLVEWVVKNAPVGAVMLDIGCGSGAIPLATADFRPDMKITGVDISEKALLVAGRNRDRYKFQAVELLRSDLFSGVAGRRFDIISANLPYVAEDELAECPDEVRCFEPRLALVAEDNGLALIREALNHAGGFLNPGGRIIMEMGETQAEKIQGFMRENHFVQIELHHDYNGRPRFVSGRKI